MAIRFFIEYQNLLVQLPVNPEEIKVSFSGGNKSKEVINLGEITLIKERKLATIKLTSFLPLKSDAPYVLTKGRFEGPQFYIDLIQRIVEDKQPLRFTITDTKINMLATIEDFSYGQIGGDLDTHYEISIKEYRPFKAKVLTLITEDTETSTIAVAKVSEANRQPTGFAIGDAVIVSGKYWYDSYGSSPFGTFNNFIGTINHIVFDKTRQYKYHIITTAGASKGWVSEPQLSHK